MTNDEIQYALNLITQAEHAIESMRSVTAAKLKRNRRKEIRDVQNALATLKANIKEELSR